MLVLGVPVVVVAEVVDVDVQPTVVVEVHVRHAKCGESHLCHCRPNTFKQEVVLYIF